MNSTRSFFTVIISHVLLQINPNKFELNIDSYADLTQLLNQQADLIIEFTLNEILAYIRYDVAKTLETVINAPELNNISFSIDSFIPYDQIGHEPIDLNIQLESLQQPIVENGYNQLFFNMTLFSPLLERIVFNEPVTYIPSYLDNGSEL